MSNSWDLRDGFQLVSRFGQEMQARGDDAEVAVQDGNLVEVRIVQQEPFAHVLVLVLLTLARFHDGVELSQALVGVVHAGEGDLHLLEGDAGGAGFAGLALPHVDVETLALDIHQEVVGFGAILVRFLRELLGHGDGVGLPVDGIALLHHVRHSRNSFLVCPGFPSLSCDTSIPIGVYNSWDLRHFFAGFVFLLEHILVAVQEPGLHVGVGAVLDLGEPLHALELSQHLGGIAFLLRLDELAHDLVSQLAVGLLALLLGDLPLFDGEVGIVPADLRKLGVGGAADGARFLQEALGDDDLAFDVVDFITVSVPHVNLPFWFGGFSFPLL